MYNKLLILINLFIFYLAWTNIYQTNGITYTIIFSIVYLLILILAYKEITK